MHRGNNFDSVDKYSWKNLKMQVYFLSQTQSFSFCVLLIEKVYTHNWEILICTQVYALDFAFRRARRLKTMGPEAIAKRHRTTVRGNLNTNITNPIL